MTAPVCRVTSCDHTVTDAPIRGVVVLEVTLDPESQAPFEPVLRGIHASHLPGLVLLHIATEHAAYDVVKLVATQMPHQSDYVRRVT
jgi:hypothetical protein